MVHDSSVVLSLLETESGNKSSNITMQPGKSKLNFWVLVTIFAVLLSALTVLGATSLYLYKFAAIEVQDVSSTHPNLASRILQNFQCLSDETKETYECTNLSDCPSLQAAFYNTSLGADEQKIYKQKLCDIDGQNIKVCCSENPADRVLLRSECIMPDKKPGECVEFSSCKPLTDTIRTKWNPEIRRYWAQAKCDLQSSTPKICCPKTPVKLPDSSPPSGDSGETRGKKSNDREGNKKYPFGMDPTVYTCRSSQDGRALPCSFVKECPILQEEIKNSNAVVFFHNRSCGIERNMVKICCPDDPSDLPVRIPLVNSCTTADNRPGNCAVQDSCPEYVNANKEFLDKSGCAPLNDIPLICCPSSTETETPVSLLVKHMSSGGSDSEKTLVRNYHIKPNPIDTGTGKVAVHPLLPLSCGVESLQTRISGGTKTSLGQYPWLALLQYNDNKNPFKCGGMVISERYILTAAHCVKGPTVKPEDLISVRLGEYNTSNSEPDCIRGRGCFDPPIDFGIEEITVHSTYTGHVPFAVHDIALIRLDQTINFTRFIRPICLRNKNQPIDPSELHFVAGWGLTENRVKSEIKLQVRLPIKPFDDCKKLYSSTKYNLQLEDELQICAGGEKDRDACGGDSGGPLQSIHLTENPQWLADGVVSYGPDPCGVDKWPGVYTNIPTHVDWILSNMKP